MTNNDVVKRARLLRKVGLFLIAISMLLAVLATATGDWFLFAVNAVFGAINVWIVIINTRTERDAQARNEWPRGKA